MRILFIGCVQSSEMFLKKIIEDKADIVGVITKSESKFNADFVDLTDICIKNDIDCIYAKNINAPEIKKYIKSKYVDLILCLGWSQLLDKEILEIPRIGSIGFHPAELPMNRGRHPIIWSLVLGLEKTASTLFLMNEMPDMGKILSQEYIIIDYKDDARTLYDKVMEKAVLQISKLIKAINNNLIDFKSNDFVEGNTWRKRNKEDGKIDWRMSSRGIYNLVRALTKPYVGAHFVYKDKEYKVWKAREIITNNYKNIEPGKVIKVISNTNFWVKTEDNIIEVLECDKICLKEGEYV